MKLNKDQQNAYEKILKMFSNQDQQIIIIRGPGGTGKSHIIVQFIKQYEKLVGKTCLTAPTNKAVDVLNNFSTKVGRKIETATIYSLLGLVVGKEGEVKRTFSANEGSFDQFQTIVLDEGSMAGMQLCDIIDDKMQEYPHSKIIVMLDHCQLPPVNESITQLLNMGEIVDLTEDMRSGNGPLLQIKRAVRDLTEARIDGNKSKELQIQFETSLDETDSGVHFLRGAEFDSAMLDMFDSEQYKADPNFVRALAWTNKEVDRLNRIIRMRIYGKGCKPYMPGERMAVMNPVFYENDQVFATDEEVTVLEMVEGEYTDYMDSESKDPTYKIYRMKLKSAVTGVEYMVPVLHEESVRKFNRRCEFIADQCREKKRPWKSFWDFKDDTFVSIRPAHAMTVHKSQGQTLNCVFVNMKDLMRNKNPVERAQLVYVATSRPTTDLVVNLKTFY